MSEEWASDAYERSALVARMVELLAKHLGLPTSHPEVHAQVAAVHGLELGWAVYRDIIEYRFLPFGPDLPAVRKRLSEISTRLIGST